MALTYNTLDSVTRDKFLPYIVDAVFNSNIVIHKLYKNRVKMGTGSHLVLPVMYDKVNAGFYYGLSQLALEQKEIATKALFEWSQAYSSIVISGRDYAINKGDEQILSLVWLNFKNASMTLKDIMGTGMFSLGTEYNGWTFTGLRGAIDDGTNVDSYGGISRLTYSWWQSHYYANSSVLRDGTIDLMAQAKADASIDNDCPNVIVTSKNFWRVFKKWFYPSGRFQMDSDPGLLAAGFDNYLFEGIPVVHDSHCPANTAFLLNTNYMNFIVHPDRDFAFEGFYPLTAHQQDGFAGNIFWMGQFVNEQPRMSSKVVDLKES